MWFLATENRHLPRVSSFAVRPFVIGIRQVPTQWLRQELPLGLSESEALRHVARVARSRSLRCSLETPEGRVFWLNDRGTLIGSSRR